MDLITLLETIGYVGIALIIFSETGLLFGFFLPGDSMLFTAGFLASQGFFNILILAPLCFVAAVLGNSTGYFIGKKAGPRVFARENSLLFHKDNVHHTKEFYKKHGPKTIILAQFVPILRTFSPVMAGVGKMSYAHFFTYNIIGATLWAFLIPIIGYYLGARIPNIDSYIVPIVGVIILLSVLPAVIHLIRDARARKTLRGKIVEMWRNRKTKKIF